MCERSASGIESKYLDYNNRSSQNWSRPPLPRTMKRRRGLPLALKQPLVVFNEMFGRVDYEIIPSGVGNTAGFHASFSLDGETYDGFGTSKSKAKAEAVKSLLVSREIPFSETQEQGLLSPTQNSSPLPENPDFFRSPFSQSKSDFSKDVTSLLGGSFEGTTFSEGKLTQHHHPLEVNIRRLHERRIPFSLQKASEFPAMMFHELFPNIQDQIRWLDTDSPLRFCCAVDISGHTFHGVGVGKRAAKLELAKSVLGKFFGVKYFKTHKSTLKSDNTSTLGKMHPYARVKWLDPSAKFTFEKVDNEGDQSVWKAKLVIKGKEYESMNSEKEKAKLQVAKMGFQDNHSIDDTNMSVLVKKVIDTSKNPLQMFFEYYSSPDFMEEEIKNGASTYFMVAIKVDDQIYSASSLSKKRAKAKLALKVFEKVHGISIESWASLKDDLKADYAEDEDLPAMESKMEILQCENEKTPAKIPKTPPEAAKKSPGDASSKNAVSVLHELHQDVSFMFSDENTNNVHERFTCFVTVNGKTFDGSGPNKKSAKNAASSRALEILYGIKDQSVEIANNPQNQHESDISPEFADKVVEAAQSKFSQVFQSDISYKVVASILMAKEQNGKMLDRFEVLCMGTGTKCIGGESLCTSGKSLNDCHAEIIACRGFRQFLYDQLELAMKGKESCLAKVPKSRFFKLKPGLCLYLYINSAPCGDGRVYNMTAAASNNRTIGMLRTKIENGQGTVPVPESGIQTMDGILAGERVLTMSCSDKIMKWNVLGLQGSLLTHFLKPVYLKGIIIGEQYNYQHLLRSLYSRVESVSKLPQPFTVVKPEFGKPSKTVGRDTSKATNLSYNWYYGQTTVEAINGVTGQTPVSMPSRLSKVKFLERFRQLAKLAKVNIPLGTYHDGKVAAKAFNESKRILLESLEAQGYGKWIGKPVEHDTFG